MCGQTKVTHKYRDCLEGKWLVEQPSKATDVESLVSKPRSRIANDEILMGSSVKAARSSGSHAQNGLKTASKMGRSDWLQPPLTEVQTHVLKQAVAPPSAALIGLWGQGRLVTEGF
uniref:Uncharacterized protein n=1 Tax=Coccidioides posadasii RMSCC 3488 TaxID=454284 RepID=A0A0J6FHX6_COCPO|nr:hypothetical protein CPAG_09057 [Coccidioides posadasii RMSCC 3488]